jgi:hypothetical protein
MPVHLKMLEGRSSWDVLLTMCGPYAVKYVCSQICVAVKYVCSQICVAVKYVSQSNMCQSTAKVVCTLRGKYR